MKEIARIKADMNIKENGYPEFWLTIRRGFSSDKVNPKLLCPMNFLTRIQAPTGSSSGPVVPMEDIYICRIISMKQSRIPKKIEEMIQKYSLDLFNYNTSESDNDEYLLLLEDFNGLLKDIREIKTKLDRTALFSTLINRALLVSAGIRRNKNTRSNKTDKNRSLLLKTLYTLDSKAFLKCFRPAEVEEK